MTGKLTRWMIGGAALAAMAGCGGDSGSSSSPSGTAQAEGHQVYCLGLSTLGRATSGLQARTMTNTDAAGTLSDAAGNFHDAATLDRPFAPDWASQEQKLSDDVARLRVDLLNGSTGDAANDSGAVAQDIPSGQSC